MFGLGWLEVTVIAIVAILIFGPKKLPELGGAIGKTLRGFKDEFAQGDGEETDESLHQDRDSNEIHRD
ncbi:MAG: twin-arginine translocase TatA/TatE family subunit [Cyanobacteria bacterium]|nr:twin-arginine translocase TatA/TatE family subunit [Cyanobacteriota bacterium]